MALKDWQLTNTPPYDIHFKKVNSSYDLVILQTKNDMANVRRNYRYFGYSVTDAKTKKWILEVLRGHFVRETGLAAFGGQIFEWKLFTTKSQALKFAKSYMRTH